MALNEILLRARNFEMLFFVLKTLIWTVLLAGMTLVWVALLDAGQGGFPLSLQRNAAQLVRDAVRW